MGMPPGLALTVSLHLSFKRWCPQKAAGELAEISPLGPLQRFSPLMLVTQGSCGNRMGGGEWLTHALQLRRST